MKARFAAREEVAVPAFIGLLVMLALFGRQARLGLPMYAMDDAYIHLSVAKHIVQDHVWGNTAYEFSACSSSPLWTCLLASLMELVGPNPWIPALLNAAALLLLLWVVDFGMRNREVAVRTRLIVNLAIVLTLPTMYLCLTGMEHVLQAALDLWLIFSVWSRWSSARPDSSARDQSGGDERAGSALLSGLLALMVAAVRFEGLLLVAALGLVSLIRFRDLRLAAAILFGGALPFVTYAYFSHAHGGLLLPNSLLVKGSGGLSLHGLEKSVLTNLHTAFEVGLGSWFGLGAILLAMTPSLERSLRWLVFICVGLGWFQILLGGWVIRYFYWDMTALVVLASLALFTTKEAINPHWRRLLGVGWAGAMLIPALFMVRLAAQSMQNYRDLHASVGRFLASESPSRVVGLYDIGLASFMSDVHVVDFAGLGSLDVAKARMSGRFQTSEIDAIGKQRRLDYAILFPNQFQGETALPKGWQKVAEWSIPDNAIALDDRFEFVATSPEEAARLRRRLIEFGSSLPKKVTQTMVSPSAADE